MQKRIPNVKVPGKIVFPSHRMDLGCQSMRKGPLWSLDPGFEASKIDNPLGADPVATSPTVAGLVEEPARRQFRECPEFVHGIRQ